MQMEEDIKESRQATTNAQERLRLIKEQRKKQHEERLEKSSLFSGDGLNDESNTLKRFSKYRRSGREGSQKDDLSRSSNAPTMEQKTGLATEKTSDDSYLSELAKTKEHRWNVSPIFSSESPGPGPENKFSQVQPTEDVHCITTNESIMYKSAHASSEFRPHFSGATLISSLSLDQTKGVLKKPTIPPILRSATEPIAASSSSNDDDSVTLKKPSILKKKDQETSSSGTSFCSSGSGSGQPASVSFGLPTSKSVLTRTKSIDSNLSGDSETGYWSGGENCGGILKNRRLTVDGDQLDQSSILKLRRSSLGSSAISTSSEGGLQSILKRKLSYDSSYIMKESNANEYSFSTHSLPACGCLSPEPKPILKKKSSSEDLEEVEPKPILKHRSSRDYPDFSIDSDQRIKPCLKKSSSSSKSADEGFGSPFPTSSSLNYFTTNSYSSSIPPTIPMNGTSSSSCDGAANNNASKGILKRSGILKHQWRESSSSPSTFSAPSSDAENSRPFQYLDKDGESCDSSFSKESSSDLHRARRFFYSESDINTNSEQDMHHTLPSTTSCAVSLPSYREIRSDAAAVENGLASLDSSEELHRHPHPPSESAKSKNNNNTTNTTTGTGTIFDFDSIQIQGETSSSSDDNQCVPSQSYFQTQSQKRYYFNNTKNTKNVSPHDKSLYENKDGECNISSEHSSPYKLNWRHTSIDNNNPLPLHDVLYSISKASADHQKGTNFINSNSLCGGGSKGSGAQSLSPNQKAEVVNVTATNAMAASIRTDSHEDIIMSLSVAEKRSLFMQLEDEKKKENGFRKQDGLTSRLGRPKRYATQPITTDEVEKASKMIVQNKDSKKESESLTSGSNSNLNSTQGTTLFESDDNRHVNQPATDLPISSASVDMKNFQDKTNFLLTTHGHGRRHDTPLISHKSMDSGMKTSNVNDQLSWEGDEIWFNRPRVHHNTSPSYTSAFNSKSELDDSKSLTSKPPSGAAFSGNRNSSKESFPAPRVNNPRLILDAEDGWTSSSRAPEHGQCLVDINCNKNSSVNITSPCPPFSFKKAKDDPEQESLTSLKDRIRMFNVLASATQSQSQLQKQNRVAVKKPVTSKRFSTQPVISTTRLLFAGDSIILPTHATTTTVVDGVSSSKPKPEKTMGMMMPMMRTGSAEEDKQSTVRDEEGQENENENESEWSQTSQTSRSQSCDDISLGSTSSSSTCKSQGEDEVEDLNSCQGFPSLSETTIINKEPLSSHFQSSKKKMPEKVSDDFLLSSSSSSNENDDANSDFVKEEDLHCGDPSCALDPFSCVKRKLSKSSSANSMMMSPESDVNLFQKGKMNRTSIADKIAALQTNSDVGWKKRVTKVNPDKEKIMPTDQNDNVEFRRNNKEFKGIASRLNQLESSQDSWKKRVGENDANIFTVQGRLEKAGKIVKTIEGPITPLQDIKVKGLKVLTPLRYRNKTVEASDDSSNSPSSEDAQENCDVLKTPTKGIQDGSPKRHKQLSRSNTTSGESSEEEKVTRSISRNDNETFSVFFTPMLQSEMVSSSKFSKISTATYSVQIEDSSFNAIQVERRQLLGMRRNVKAPRNHTNVKNPVKSLALRIQEQSYAELSPQVREKEMKKRVQIENLAKNAHLSVEALAGLASKEDFTAVKLKKAGNELNKKEYPHPMLIRIKGKRQVQTRLVPPEVKSISSGDNYILVTANKMYQFIGEYSNRLERAKIADVVSHIAQKKDLGCRISSMAEVVTLEEPLLSVGRDRQQFFEILGGGDMPEANDLGDELDEAYEFGVVTTNRVFEINEIREELVPLLEAGGWGSQPRHSLLQDDKVLVFDFGSEIYVWSGSKADPSMKKTGYRLAKGLYEGAYSYVDVEPCCCPIVNSIEGSQRPSWTFIKKINQHMEPILFIEKFFDWPDDSGRLIKVQQKRTSDSSQKEASYNFKACNVEEMVASVTNIPDPGLELEGFDVGRGLEIHNSEDRRTFTITNLDVKAWNISEFSKSDVEESSLGQFYSEETYVIRWQFSVTQIGRDLKGNKSRHAGVLGRERCTYFFWQGKQSKITEQGTSALMTVELDQEKGPQVRIEQGREPPAFLSRFKGLMFVHLGCREAPLKDSKLYVTMGACESEGHFIEVQCEANSFRSLGSFILVDFVKGRIYLWHGSLSTEVIRKIACHGAKNIVEAPDRYLNFHGAFRLIELEEGSENQAFFSCLDVPNKTQWTESYVSLKGLNQEDYAEVSVFAFSSLQGSFEANPILSLKRKLGSPEAFPVLQEELYCAQQPRLFLVSRGPETWLWQGWTPLGDEDNENMATGSGEIRLAAERKAALETAIHWAKLKGTVGYLVLAGLESARFTNIFPYWNLVDEAREVNMTEGRSPGLTIPLDEAMQPFLKASYTLEELQERPDGVDQSKLEKYLSDEEFETVLKMGKEEFNKLQSWKQTELKKAVGLF